MKGDVARKLCRFALNANCLFPKAKYIHLDRNLLLFTSLMTKIFIFRFFESFFLNYDQNTLRYCFSSMKGGVAKNHAGLPKMPILLRP